MRMGFLRFSAPIVPSGTDLRYEGDRISVGLQLWVSETLIAKKDVSDDCEVHNPICDPNSGYLYTYDPQYVTENP